MNAPPPANLQRELRQRLAALPGHLEAGLVERGRVVRLALLAALAGEHTLLVGPPGTAKSELARRLHLAFAGASYFERLLTRFTVPEELFGPLSISALEQDRYERITTGFLPQATIAFIDEVFKANSAILNALLTLLNEREFDNGAGRERCPLVSVIGATNEVPADEVAEAFFDRFLMRLPVGPVSGPGFLGLLALDHAPPPGGARPLDEADLAALQAAAAAVRLPAQVAALLAELRALLAGEQAYVSDRRWVKVAWLLKVAAASEGRDSVAVWDLWLLPWCVAPGLERQADITAWLTARLGLEPGMAPPLLTRVVEAFEAQAALEQQAEDLDYDEDGRLRFSADLAASVNDAKGASQVARISYRRQRRYGEIHIHARVRQVDELVDRIAGYAEAIAASRAELAAYTAQAIWMDREFAAPADANLAATSQAIEALRVRALAAREAFLALPRREVDPGTVPEPVTVARA
ncbi:AAA domain-containing protein [Ramlibacter sp. RBP-2]|uniref:AAA domain-containing protein n=1 Tax=Ramlibacter lithotrophicus TaxID=2606681 RepID=A0A7X6DJM2_9BURK|nr:AAA family ATPase [Ramlibacter lithotrophicus]NKE68384.1 AAA domain-containing protein [Ramlibacter lithotrophicus]